MRALLIISLLLGAVNAFPLLSKCKLLELSHDLSSQTITFPIKSYTDNKFKLHQMIRGMTGPTVKGSDPFYFYYNTFSAVEHISTHMDAPNHLLKDMTVASQAKTIDQVSLSSLIGEACVIDIPKEHQNNKDYLLTIEDAKNWEMEHGLFHDECFVFIRSGQGKFWGDTNKYLGSDDPAHLDPFSKWPDNLHWPGMHWETAQWILENRGMKGVGQDAMSFDYGLMLDFSKSVHTVVLGANKPGFENLANLDKLPNRGATVVALPMLIKDGSGAPAHIVAIGWDGENDPCRLDSSTSGVKINLALSFLTALTLYFCL